MAEVSVHRAMCSCKTITKRLNRIIENINIVGFTKGTSARVLNGAGQIIAPSAAELEKEARADYSSAIALINNYHATRCAIIKSNAGVGVDAELNRVSVNNVAMTVAEAIELKHGVAMLEELKSTLASRWGQLSAVVTKIEADNERRLDAQLASMKDATDADKQTVTDMFKVMNDVKIVDPLGTVKLVAKLEDVILTFRENVDVVLSESNASTKITVDENLDVFNLM